MSVMRDTAEAILAALLLLGASLQVMGDELCSLDPPVLLPDGTEFKTWERPLTYTKTYYVSQAHPKASDDNPGTEAEPFQTVDRAAQVLQPGERVLVGEGVYREWVRPRRGGTGPDAMIGYHAAPGAKVVIKGSRVLQAVWEPAEPAAPGGGAKAWSAAQPQADVPVVPLPEFSLRRLGAIPWKHDGGVYALACSGDGRLSGKITLANIGTAVRLGRTQLAEIFKAKQGENIVAYVNRRRVEQAQQLLRKTDMPIIDIGFETGFGDVSHFNHTFKRIAGVSPRQYRAGK